MKKIATFIVLLMLFGCTSVDITQEIVVAAKSPDGRCFYTVKDYSIQIYAPCGYRVGDKLIDPRNLNQNK